LLDQFVIL